MNDGPIIMTAGRLVPWKGFGTLISIMPNLLKKKDLSKNTVSETLIVSNTFEVSETIRGLAGWLYTSMMEYKRFCTESVSKVPSVKALKRRR